MTNKREFFKHYIGVTEDQEKEMLQAIGLEKLDDLYSHIDKSVLLDKMKMPAGMSQEEVKTHISAIASKNNIKTSFIGDGLQDFKVQETSALVSNIRGLTTAYTPYQPERSQGTLQTLWIYQSLISKITGFEAINASMYERSTCLYEALSCATRIKRNKLTILVPNSLYPGDIEVLETHKKHTKLNIQYINNNPETGLVDQAHLKKLLSEFSDVAAIVVPQTNTFGLIEDFDALTDIAKDADALTIAMIDLVALASTGLKEPSLWGSDKTGADILVGEAQHMVINTSFGGPGLGVFGIRYNEKNKNMIRQTAGRFIGEAKDLAGRKCKSIILSTREQHIRRDKATSNICSNQSFLASLCGATLLERGSSGISKSFKTAHKGALKLIQELTQLEGVDLLYTGAVFNEFTLKINKNIKELIQLASAEENLHIGVDISGRCNITEQLLKISVSDKHSAHEHQKMINFFRRHFKSESISNSIASIPTNAKRINTYTFKNFDVKEIEDYYKRLGKQNLSPDEAIYPLGSCTMKYNPELNEWAANLDSFCHTHPQAPENDVQGNLEILFEIQELFKDITGLPAVTTQPVAGAQGEFVGIKMFQAYHEHNGEAEQRDIILIPRSAHGTNPATATMAGFETKKSATGDTGIITVEANDQGEIDYTKLTELIQKYNKRISGIMITNPNTAGIFETRFKDISKQIHDVGGLVYMDGANMNAIAGWLDLDKLGVDAVHNNLHKTWSIPHGGGGPGDAIVAVSHRLIDFMPGVQVVKKDDRFELVKPKHSMGSIHRHFGNFGHKLRAYAYLKALGADGIKRMSAIAVLSARYLYKDLKNTYAILPAHSENNPRMHEFILTLSDETFNKIAAAGTPKPQIIARVGKLFLDFGFHAPTVAFPEVYGLMLEPTESFTKEELDEFCAVVKTIHKVLDEYPEVLQTVPHFTPIDRVDEVTANKIPLLSEDITTELSPIIEDRIASQKLRELSRENLIEEIVKAHKEKINQL